MSDSEHIKYVKNFYKEAVFQLINQTKATTKDATLKVGLMVLYFWASVYDNSETLDSIKNEGKNYLINSELFFEEAKQDFLRLKFENHPVINHLSKLTMDDYNSLIDYFQKEFIV
ncbi:MAG TPA: hypothetical protein PL041_03665 [Melioribacteraceae bacterium]|nr:hypothetical protein [Melioribacteraceae bacterium]